MNEWKERMCSQPASQTNQPTNELTKELTDGGDLRKSTSWRPSACSAISPFYRIAGLSRTPKTITRIALMLRSFPPWRWQTKDRCACCNTTMGGMTLTGMISGIQTQMVMSKFTSAAQIRHVGEDTIPEKSAGCASMLRIIPWHLAYNWGRKNGNSG
jgi:hypothetical protein